MAFRASSLVFPKHQGFKLMLATLARIFENWHFRTPVVAVIQYKCLSRIFTDHTRFNLANFES